MNIVDRRWSYVGFIVMVLGLFVLIAATFPQQLGIPLDVPLGWFGSAAIALGVMIYLVQRRAEHDGRRGDPPAPS